MPEEHESNEPEAADEGEANDEEGRGPFYVSLSGGDHVDTIDVLADVRYSV